MAHSRRAIPHSNRASSRGEQDLTALSSEVLKLRLQALNLPITGSKGQLLNRLKRALPGKAATSSTAQPKRVSKAPKPRKRRSATRTNTATRRSSESLPANLDNTNNEDALSDRASLSSIKEMIESDPEPDESNFQQNIGFSRTQRAAIETIVSDSVRSAITTLQTSPAAHLPSAVADLPSASTQNPFKPGLASPLGLSRPVDKTMEDKTLRGEYIEFALLLPDTLYQSQSPEIQLRLDDSSSGPMGSPVTMVRKKKPFIDTFPKWLDAYMTYMLVLVNAYPRRALELVKYQQIISRAVAKFKGLAWLSYDQQFRRRAAYDLSLSWDKVDLELWTVTFAGLAKPHCNACLSPYHTEDVCPSAGLNRKSRRPQTATIG